MDARKVGGTVQAALSRVADVMAADKATADPTNAKAEGVARGEALSLPSSLASVTMTVVDDKEDSPRRRCGIQSR